MRQLKITKQVTNRETASLDKYLQEIGKVDLITADMEVELAQRIKMGDQVALEKLTKANLRFVVSVAKQFQNKGLPLSDLINEGNIGLIKAAKKFDETRGRYYLTFPNDTRFYLPNRVPKTVPFDVNDDDPNDQYAQMYSDTIVDAINAMHVTLAWTSITIFLVLLFK